MSQMNALFKYTDGTHLSVLDNTDELELADEFSIFRIGQLEMQ